MAGSLVKLSEFIFKVFILCFQSYLCSFFTIFPGPRVQFRHLLANQGADIYQRPVANLRKIYIHDVNIDASQADRALNWTARINKVNTGTINTHFLNQKYIYRQLLGYLGSN